MPYRNSKYWPQLQELAFDLAIVTLGTNDAKLAFWESPDFGVEKCEAAWNSNFRRPTPSTQLTG